MIAFPQSFLVSPKMSLVLEVECGLRGCPSAGSVRKIRVVTLAATASEVVTSACEVFGVREDERMFLVTPEGTEVAEGDRLGQGR